MGNTVKSGSVRAWILAARPKTLSAALTPVVAASAFAAAEGRFRWTICLLCLLFATVMQVAANLINDVMDFQRGTDTAERLGPERAVAQGWLSPRACYRGVWICLALAALVGLVLLVASGAWIDWTEERLSVDWTAVGVLVMLGAACGLFAFLYTSLLSYVGLGDVLVYVFFGLVPVVGTYYVHALSAPTSVWLLAVAVGLVVDTLLVLNNYRDRDTDRQTGKRTLVALLGERFGNLFYLLQGLAGAVLAVLALRFLHEELRPAHALVLLYIFSHLHAWRTMVRLREGRALNRVLALTSQSIVLFGLTVSAAALL